MSNFSTYRQKVVDGFDPSNHDSVIAQQKAGGIGSREFHDTLESAFASWVYLAKTSNHEEAAVLRDVSGIGNGMTFRWTQEHRLSKDFGHDPAYAAVQTPKDAYAVIEARVAEDAPVLSTNPSGPVLGTSGDLEDATDNEPGPEFISDSDPGDEAEEAPPEDAAPEVEEPDGENAP